MSSDRPGALGRWKHVRAALGLLVACSLVGALASALWWATGGEPGRVRLMTVATGSMRPTLDVGDVVVAEVVPASEIEAGDVVTYREPTGERLVTRRVQSVVWTGRLGSVVARGDAGEAAATLTVDADDAFGRVELRIPRVGYAVQALSTTAGRLVLTGAALALGAYALLLLRRPRREDATAEVRARYASASWPDDVAELDAGDTATGGPMSVTDADESAAPSLAEPQGALAH